MSVKICNMNFNLENSNIFNNVNLEIEKGTRNILVGANGAGKTTLLKLLAGKHLCENILVLDKHSFRDTTLNFKRSFLSPNWGTRNIAFAGNSVQMMVDLRVDEMMIDLQRQYSERAKELLDVLEIEKEWRLPQLSDGQRRRVQIFLGLIRPVEIILLDEITNVLDIVIREKLMNWLKKESIQNKTTIIYATHIFDGLDGWYSNVVLVKEKKVYNYKGSELKQPIYTLVKKWINDTVKEKETILKKSSLSNSVVGAGGFAPGRFYNYW